MKHLLLLALILGSVPVAAHGVLDCKVYNGYKQFDIIGYFPLRFTLHKTQQDKVEISGWFQDSRPNPDGFDSVGPFCLSSKINMVSTGKPEDRARFKAVLSSSRRSRLNQNTDNFIFKDLQRFE